MDGSCCNSQHNLSGKNKKRDRKGKVKEKEHVNVSMKRREVQEVDRKSEKSGWQNERRRRRQGQNTSTREQ